jgi:hypothetical protein
VVKNREVRKQVIKIQKSKGHGAGTCSFEIVYHPCIEWRHSLVLDILGSAVQWRNPIVNADVATVVAG